MITAASTPVPETNITTKVDRLVHHEEVSPITSRQTLNIKHDFSDITVVRRNITHTLGFGSNYLPRVKSLGVSRSKDFSNVDIKNTSCTRKRKKTENALDKLSPLKVIKSKSGVDIGNVSKPVSDYFGPEKSESLIALENSFFDDVDFKEFERDPKMNSIHLLSNASEELFNDMFNESFLNCEAKNKEEKFPEVSEDLFFEDSNDANINEQPKPKDKAACSQVKFSSSLLTSIPDPLANIPSHTESSLNKSSPLMDFQQNEVEAEGSAIPFHFDSLSGISKLFAEADFVNAGEESMSDRIKRKLMENSVKSFVCDNTKVEDEVVEFVNQNSSFHELGPFFGLPSKIKELVKHFKGIEQLYDWQEECLNLPAIKTRKNLIYSLPTSGGKTLVAEILILRELLCHKKNVLFILPFIAVVQEKVRNLSQFAVDLNFLVEEYAAGKGVIPPRKRRRKNTVIIATIEKGLIIVQSLLESKRLGEIGLVVVDELHLLSEDSGRGATLETLLTYILYSKEKVQIIGMSATIGNLNELGQFLNADTYSGTFRPVELTEYVKCGNNIYTVDWNSEDSMKHVRALSSSSPSSDPDGITELVQEVIPNDSVLIFCATKKNCENVAVLLCNNLSKDLLLHKTEAKKSLFRALSHENNGTVCKVLQKTLPYGVVYHHSGLTGDERKLLEEAFRDETICAICCTSTLAAGVNLPARRVILRSPYVGRDFISLSKYKQMVGRAGRAGMKSVGESYLICQSQDAVKVGLLLKSKMDESVSKLHQNNLEQCRNMILCSIGLGVSTTRRELRSLLCHTLMCVQAEKLELNVNEITDKCISDIYKKGALKVVSEDAENNEISKLDLNSTQSNDHKYKSPVIISNDTKLTVSRLGKAAMKGSLSLERAHQLYTDLIQAESSLVLLTSLHLLYLVTPPETVEQFTLNGSVYFNVYSQLRTKELQTAKVLGITDGVMTRIMLGQKVKNVAESVIKRFYVSLVMNELWKQQTVWEVAILFQVPRGLVQSLMTAASSFASNVLRFCEELEELWPFKALLGEFAPRLAYCCESELLSLMELPAVKRGRARQLYNAGYKTLQLLAAASPEELVGSIDHLPRRAAVQIISAAKLQLMEKVENLREEADAVLENLGQPVVASLML